jgi:hypothetical protein
VLVDYQKVPLAVNIFEKIIGIITIRRDNAHCVLVRNYLLYMQYCFVDWKKAHVGMTFSILKFIPRSR